MKQTTGAAALLRSLFVVAFTILPTVIGVCEIPGPWYTYHHDNFRSGYNNQVRSLNASSPNGAGLDRPNMGLVWTFPMPPAEQGEEDILTVDDGDTFFWDNTRWNRAGSDDANQGDFLWQDGTATATEVTSEARWRCADSFIPGEYRIFAKFPTSPAPFPIPPPTPEKTHTTKAVYTVTSDDGVNTFEIDQTAGGSWVEIGERGFMLSPGCFVRLTNYAEDASDTNKVIVCADAIKFVPTLNQAVYSSAAAAGYTGDARMPNFEITWPQIPVVYTATVESPRWAEDTGTDYGSVYCVNSDTMKRPPLNKWYAGRAIWKYPKPVSPDDPFWTDPSLWRPRGDLEGPIQGGVYSSPAYWGRDTNGDGNPDDGIVFFAAMDRQVYALNAETGDLIWKGPGQTVSEKSSPSGIGAWTEVTSREDAVGGSFLKIAAASERGSDDIVWDGPGKNDDYKKMFNGGTGRLFDIYVWLPRKGPGDGERVRSAKYEIDYSYTEGTDVVTKTDVVTLDQECSNRAGSGACARPRSAESWVKLGNSYFNPASVKLMKSTDYTPDVDSGAEIVADAIMFIPSHLGQFSYSNPAVAGSGAQRTILVGNTNGRVYALQGLPSGTPPRTTFEQWVYPAVRTERVPTPATDDQAPWGPIVASPTVVADDAYIASMNGRIYKLGTITGPAVTFDPLNPVQFPATTESPKNGFSSSPAVDWTSGNVFAASLDGEVYKLDNKLELKWTFPGSTGSETEGTSTVVGAFRYATPIVKSNASGAPPIIYAGSSDGNLYAIEDEGNTWSPYWHWFVEGVGVGTGDPQETAQSLTGPILSSPAVDADNAGMGAVSSVYCADMSGIVWWMRADSGAMPEWAGRKIGDSIFSSPSLAQVASGDAYMYIGSDDGRLYAFSATVNDGGQWIGEEDGIEEPGGDNADVKKPDPTGSVQAQIVDFKTYNDIQTHPPRNPCDNSSPDYWNDSNPLLKIIQTNCTPEDEKNTWEGHEIGKELRKNISGAFTGEAIHEWGDSIYVVVWNLNKRADMTSVKIEMRSSSRTGGTTLPSGEVNPGSGGADAGSSPTPGSPSNYVEYEAKDATGVQVTKSYVTHQFQIPQSWLPTNGSGRPPAAGTAWIINVLATVKQASESGSGTVNKSISVTVPELDNSGKPVKLVSSASAADVRYKPQYISINNPLALKADKEIAWTANSADPMARVNGVGGGGLSGSYWQRPNMEFGLVNHGTNTPQYLLGVMDRSCLGVVGLALERFRVATADLYWRGGKAAVTNLLPWDYPPTEERGNYMEFFTGLTNAYVGSQKDYPDIRQRYQSFKKLSDGANPVTSHCRLLGAKPGAGSDLGQQKINRRLVPDPLEVYVNVPRFQPANPYPNQGYSSTMRAYLDTTNNGGFDDGNFISGKPTSYIEPYRPFRTRVQVAPDYRIRVEESVIDLGKAPHGLGHKFNPWDPFQGALDPPTPWFHDFTVKNLGNINVINVRADPWNLLSSQSAVPLGAANVITSLDPAFDTTTGVDQAPISGYGHTISKARVGDTEPTVMEIPDSRILESLPSLPSLGKPKVGIVTPLTQPIGTYAQILPIRADLPGAGSVMYADPTFVLKLTVREDRLTDGYVDGALAQIDDPLVAPRPKAGDVQPAVFRDYDPINANNKAPVHMFWSSNRSDLAAPPDPTPNDPWYIYAATLPFQNGWQLGVPWGGGSPPVPGRWWATAMSGANLQRMPDPTGIPWPATGAPGTPVVETTKHLAAAVAQDPTTPGIAETWMFWQGQIYRNPQPGQPGTLNQENRVFYTDVTGGNIANDIYSFTEDFSMIKYSPRPLVYTVREDGSQDYRWLWAFHYGGDANRWNIYYNACREAVGSGMPRAHSPSENGVSKWSPDRKLPTPSSLASVSDPLPILHYSATRDSDNSPLLKPVRHIDVIYTGVSKTGQNSDVYLSRYWIGVNVGDPKSVRLDPYWVDPSNNQRKPLLPRIRNEVMARDQKTGVYSAQNIWWWEPVLTGTPVANIEPSIKLRIPDNNGVYGSTIDATAKTTINGEVSPVVLRDQATGMFIYAYKSADPRAATLRQLIMDAQSGTVRFGKPLPAKTKVKASYVPRALRLSATTRVDAASYWSGVGFGSNWAEDEPGDPRDPGGNAKSALTLRWGGSADSDTASFALIDKTENTSGTLGFPAGWPTADGLLRPIDRMWLFWRKPASGVRATTVFYKTMRLGIQLSKRIRTYVDTDKDGVVDQIMPSGAALTVTGNVGPYEVDWTRGRIYFTELDERIPGWGLPGPAAPITVEYIAVNPNNPSGPGVSMKESFDTVFWSPESQEEDTDKENAYTDDITLGRSEQPPMALLGSAAEAMVNEGQVSAFTEPEKLMDPNTNPAFPLGIYKSKIWVFWASTRTGQTDLFYETLCPVFRPETL